MNYSTVKQKTYIYFYIYKRIIKYLEQLWVANLFSFINLRNRQWSTMIYDYEQRLIANITDKEHILFIFRRTYYFQLIK